MSGASGAGLSPVREADALVAALLRERSGYPSDPSLRGLPSVQAMLAGSEELHGECVLRLVRLVGDDDWATPLVAWRVLAIVLRRRASFTRDGIRSLLCGLRDTSQSGRWHGTLANALFREIEAAVCSWSEAEREKIAPLVDEVAATASDSTFATRLRQLVSEQTFVIAGGDDAAERVKAVLVDAGERPEAVGSVLAALQGYPGAGKASKRWLSSARTAGEALESPAGLTGRLLDALIHAEDTQRTHSYGEQTYTRTFFLVDDNERVACGIAALTGLVGDTGCVGRLGSLAAKSATIIGGRDGFPRSLRLANTCAHAIAQIGAPSSITELLALERSVSHGGLLKEIRKAMAALAAAQGTTREELLEQAVEDHRLGPDGRRRFALDRGHAVIEVSCSSVSVTYVDVEGSIRKSVPAAVKAANAETLTQAQAAAKAIRKTLAGERHRLENLMRHDRRWSLARWQQIYLRHPITGRLGRSLVWLFRGSDGREVTGVPVDERTVTTATDAREPMPRSAEVRLWHPIYATQQEIQRWRERLLDGRVAQPFKQAFRELYVLTPAEAQTRLYSNRFASHIFRQDQARALFKRRGWRPVPVAWWDDGIDHGYARRDFEQCAVRAEFYFDPIVDIEPTSSDQYPYCTSDQMRFIDTERDEPISLTDVPPLVFSEAMRDIDLVVAVSSVGADPEWLDRGEGRRFETYWQSFSFGELNESAKVRRQVLERLIPALAIADRCELQNRFLNVRGNVRSYRIHLGSGNILMSPHDQYLCIVAARDRRASRLFLPFDDDPILTLILSKAFMLAEDDKITDPTIWGQIKLRPDH